jgi:prepilin-type N-terminal cleavage/methylation domain-containing protein
MPATSRFPVRKERRAFTLIELLVVIAVISLLAAMIFPITKAVNRNKIRTRAKGELIRLETVIEAYKSKLGVYPPSGTNNPAINPLYYELVGTTLSGANYSTLDGSAQITAVTVPTVFGPAVGGFVNSSRGGGGDEGPGAVRFLKELRTGQFLATVNPNFSALGTGLDGPLMLTNAAGSKLNPWRYNSANPTNNPNSFDLWIDVLVDGKTNRICNWSKEPLIVY